MKNLILIMALTITSSAYSRTFKKSYQLASSDLMYTVHYPLKTVEGHNKSAKGKAVCEKDPCTFLVAAEIKNFDSGDSNRDLHMREVTKESVHHFVTIRGTIPKEIKSDKVEVDLQVELAGEKQTIPHVPFTFKDNGDLVDADGQFPISLKQFKIKAPSLLGVPIDDSVPMKIHTSWKAI